MHLIWKAHSVTGGWMSGFGRAFESVYLVLRWRRAPPSKNSVCCVFYTHPSRETALEIQS